MEAGRQVRERGTIHFWVELRYPMGWGVVKVPVDESLQVNSCIGLWHVALPMGTCQSEA